MINLAPSDYKESLRYAHYNSVVLKWIIGLGILLAIISSTILLGKAYLQSQSGRYTQLNQQLQQDLKHKDIDTTTEKIESISSNLKLINDVLSRQVIFSKLIQQVGAVIPANAVLTEIEISQVEGGLDLVALATDYETAVRTQLNLSDPTSKLFDKVDIESVQCNQTGDYPCKIMLRALFTKQNPYLFINIDQEEAS